MASMIMLKGRISQSLALPRSPSLQRVRKAYWNGLVDGYYQTGALTRDEEKYLNEYIAKHPNAAT